MKLYNKEIRVLAEPVISSYVIVYEDGHPKAVTIYELNYEEVMQYAEEIKALILKRWNERLVKSIDEKNKTHVV